MSSDKSGYPIVSVNPRPIWRLRMENREVYQIPEDFVDKYIFKIVDKLIALIRGPTYNHDLSFATFVINEFFISFDTDVLDFLKLHQLELIYPLVREGVIVSLKRNAKHVQMCDIQPSLAVRYKVWTVGTSLDFFLQNRERLRRFSTQKWVRSRILEHSKMRKDERPGGQLLNLPSC
ncbi:uncharacterized protein LOC123004654 [Tribolium madens]|uniref:uncharacterized protein LOC123004654 n=1 Tax=Tribolium madens TaxID=41895 RepID=UPI001CF75E57|nr:uncharacterized protein LOC123004654 [Tribolium madens]